jgi:hypothetical protein
VDAAQQHRNAGTGEQRVDRGSWRRGSLMDASGAGVVVVSRTSGFER